MIKAFVIGIATLIISFAVVGGVVAHAQTATPSPSPTPTSSSTTPSGAPNTGFGY